MLNFLHKTLLQVQVRIACFESVSLTKNPCFISSLSRTFLSTSTASDNDSFVVSYLIESCGLSRDSALQASKHVNITNPDTPNRVLAFFRSHGFSDAQISKFVKGFPLVLALTPERCLSPKFEFFYSKGISKPDAAHVCCVSPNILSRSLEKSIIPSFDFYKQYLFKSDEKVVAALKRNPRFFLHNPGVKLAAVMDVFRCHGTPESNIIKLLCQWPRCLSLAADTLKSNIERVKEIGFDPKSMMFIVALLTMSGLSKTSWKRKIYVYSKWGWSEETVMRAFLKFPHCMSKSEEKVTAVMDHFVNKLGCDPSLLASYPVIFSYSLEGRIIPRTSVLKFLREKGMLRKNSSWFSPLTFPEKLFLERYINRYEKEASTLLKIYKER